jgi:hypothetical protein
VPVSLHRDIAAPGFWWRDIRTAAQLQGPAEPFSRHLLGGRARGQHVTPGAVEHLGGGVADLLLDLGERLTVTRPAVLGRGADDAARVRDHIGNTQHTAVGQLALGVAGYRDVGSFQDNLRRDLPGIGCGHHIGLRCGNKDLAIHAQDVVSWHWRAAVKTGDRPLGLVRHHRRDIEPLGIPHGAPDVGDGDDYRTAVTEGASCVAAHGAEALDDNARPGDVEHLGLAHDLGTHRQPEPGRAEFIQRDASEHGRHAHGPADLVVHVTHRRLARAHVRPGNVVGELLNRTGEGTHHAFVTSRRRARRRRYAGLPATVRQPGNGILHGHRARQARHLAGCDIGPGPHSADRGAERDVVNDHHRLDPRARAQKNDLRRAQFIGSPAGRRLHHRYHLP